MKLRTKHAVTETGRTILGRLLPGTDLVPGILSICSEAGIRFGYIPSLIGSLSRVRFIYVKEPTDKTLKFVFSSPLDIEGPCEILSSQGTLGESEDGKPFLHLHALLCDKNDHIFGGHILEEGSPVLATIEVVIQEVRGARIIRTFDEETQVYLFNILC